jgi:hypothetical protein
MGLLIKQDQHLHRTFYVALSTAGIKYFGAIKKITVNGKK